jgi:EmrB/QacA subfamily drug resistance transporter
MSDPAAVAPDTTITRQAWLALSVTTLVTFLVVIDLSAVNVAFPSIREDFDVSRSQLSWVVSGYSVTVGALLLFAGRLGDSLGRRRVFLPGVVIFLVGSLLSGLAPNATLLIAARVFQATGGAVTMATSFAVMLPDFPPARRSTAIGIAGAAGSFGAVVGPAFGAFVIDAFNWRAIFLVNVPLCILVLVLGPRFLRESSDPDATGRIDLLGVVIGTAAVTFVMLAIVQSESLGVDDPRVVALFLTGLVLFPLLIRRSRTHPEPLLDLSLFRYRSYRSTNLGVLFYGLGFTSGGLAGSLALQDLWDQSIRMTGLALMPGPLIAVFVSPITGSVADRIGHRWVLGVGCAMCGSGYLGYLLFLDETPHIWDHFVPLGLLVGLGIGLTVATWSSAGLSDIPPAKFGVAGATFNTIRQASYALGISVVITLISLGADELDLSGYRWAWGWVAACYFVSAILVMVTFPAGSSHDRSMAETTG